MRWAHVLLAALVMGCPWWALAQAETPATLAEQRAKAVTQVVLGILSYARWPATPAQNRPAAPAPMTTASQVSATAQPFQVKGNATCFRKPRGT